MRRAFLLVSAALVFFGAGGFCRILASGDGGIDVDAYVDESDDFFFAERMHRFR
jgi:hypothetical protein